MKARGAQSKPEARLNRRYSIEALFGTAEDRILSYLRKRCMAFLQNELLIDMYSLCAILLTTGLGLAEALRQSETMADFIAHGHVLASHLIGASLPLMEKTLGFEADLVHFNMMNLSLRGLSHEQGANRSMHRQIRKLRIIDKILEGLDVHVFPWTVPIHYAAVRCITRSHLDPNILLTAGDDCAMRIWDIRTGACMGYFAGHTSIVSWCAFSPDDKLIVSASFDMSLKVWDSRTGRCTCTLTGHSDSILDGDLSANGKLILSASMDGTVRLWSIETGACYRVYRGHREGSWVKVVRFLPEDAGFVSGGLDGRVALWRIHSADHAKGSPWKKRDRASTRREGSSRSVSAAKNSPPLMAPYAPKFDDLEARAERQVCEEQELALRPMHVFTDLHSDVIVSMEVLVRRQRSALLVTASKDGSQQIVDLSTFELLKSIMSAASSTWAITVAISNDGRFFALAYFDNTVHIHAMHNYALLRRIHVQNRGITRLLFAPDASYIVIGTSTGKLQVIAL
ncbi:WD repeat-containing protein 5 [Hondaea fermentalgiana]|uniref:WD repeat-containing protein 5 n=1 Tax=Hondaea fermentalgiana TaxID=2315210 RepID=A0A2R5G0U7_9STRA|nr:WD repeat-containing protein 5 [Hondaea fermentalgiana]|eukprot:GBG24630.1 WD repeat-containing protein 5 [Hondaea fermentalgiana]